MSKYKQPSGHQTTIYSDNTFKVGDGPAVTRYAAAAQSKQRNDRLLKIAQSNSKTTLKKQPIPPQDSSGRNSPQARSYLQKDGMVSQDYLKSVNSNKDKDYTQFGCLEDVGGLDDSYLGLRDTIYNMGANISERWNNLTKGYLPSKERWLSQIDGLRESDIGNTIECVTDWVEEKIEPDPIDPRSYFHMGPHPHDKYDPVLGRELQGHKNQYRDGFRYPLSAGAGISRDPQIQEGVHSKCVRHCEKCDPRRMINYREELQRYRQGLPVDWAHSQRKAAKDYQLRCDCGEIDQCDCDACRKLMLKSLDFRHNYLREDYKLESNPITKAVGSVYLGAATGLETVIDFMGSGVGLLQSKEKNKQAIAYEVYRRRFLKNAPQKRPGEHVRCKAVELGIRPDGYECIACASCTPCC